MSTTYTNATLKSYVNLSVFPSKEIFYLGKPLTQAELEALGSDITKLTSAQKVVLKDLMTTTKGILKILIGDIEKRMTTTKQSIKSKTNQLEKQLDRYGVTKAQIEELLEKTTSVSVISAEGYSVEAMGEVGKAITTLNVLLGDCAITRELQDAQKELTITLPFQKSEYEARLTNTQHILDEIEAHP